MNVSVILSHPNQGSFNHALAEACVATFRRLGHDVILHDLHAEAFDPVYAPGESARNAVLPPAIEKHVAELEKADALVLVHPNYWSRPPAMLCGWTDRVLRAGRAYRFVPDGKGGAKPEGLLKLRFALVVNTANTPQERELSALGDPLAVHWAKVVFGMCGISRVERVVFSPVITSTPELRAEWLKSLGETCEKLVS